MSVIVTLFECESSEALIYNSVVPGETEPYHLI